MNIENSIEETVEAINALTKFVKSHQSAVVDYESLEELEQAISDLQEVAYELEARVTSEKQDGETSDEY